MTFSKWQFKNLRRSTTICLILSSFAACASQPVLAEQSATDDKAKSAPSTNKDPNDLEVLSLNDLNDTAILLRFIKEQSIYIYEEAARVPVSVNANAEYKPPDSIPVELKVKKFLPPRQQWLVFYVGTMEPVIRELAKDASAIEAGSKKLVIPDAMKEVLEPAWTEWSQNTKEMNQHLDELVPMFDANPPSNTDIQNKSVEIYNNVVQLEKIRKKLFIFLKDSMKAGGKDKVLISPF